MHAIGKYVGLAVLTGGLLAGGLGITSSARVTGAPPAVQKERHPHIHRAMRRLREARAQLKEAAHDYGGHRTEALKHVDRAIKQLELALQYDKK